MGIEEKIGSNPVGVPELAVFDDVESGELAPLPDPIQKVSIVGMILTWTRRIGLGR